MTYRQDTLDFIDQCAIAAMQIIMQQNNGRSAVDAKFTKFFIDEDTDRSMNDGAALAYTIAFTMASKRKEIKKLNDSGRL